MTNLPELDIDIEENPLSPHFRQPGLSVALPTGGAFLPNKGVALEANGEVSILPMVAADEMLLKNPDALMSGHAIKNLIRSCAPAFRVVDEISMPDLDVLLLAIRAATFGDNMDMDVQCEKCEESAIYECNLPAVLATVKQLPREIAVDVGKGLVAFLRPFTIATSLRSEMATFNQYRKLQALEGDDYTEDQRTEAKNEAFEVLSAARTKALAESVISIKTPTQNVSKPKFILEFLQKSGAAVLSDIEDRLAEINDLGMDKTVEIVCANANCGHTWKTKIEFNPATFFERSSSV